MADFPLPSAVRTQRNKANSRLSLIQEDDAQSLLGDDDDDDVDDGGCGDDNRKMPARRDERTTSSSPTTADDVDGRGDDNQKMPARRDATARQTSTAGDDGDMDAFLSSCEYNNVDEGGEDEDHDGDEVEGEDEDGDNKVEGEDEDGDKVEGEDEDGDKVEGGDEDGNEVEGEVNDDLGTGEVIQSHGDDVDPSSLFLHADKDAACVLGILFLIMTSWQFELQRRQFSPMPTSLYVGVKLPNIVSLALISLHKQTKAYSPMGCKQPTDKCTRCRPCTPCGSTCYCTGNCEYKDQECPCNTTPN